MSAPDDKTVLVGSFDISRQMPNQSSFVMHGYIFNGDTAKELNDRIDSYMAAATRQVLISGLEMLDGQGRQQLASIEGIRGHMQGLADKQKGGIKLNQQEKTQVAQGDASIEGYKKNLKQIATDRAELQAKIAAMSG